MLRQLPFLICLLFSTALGLAQKNELELTMGNTWSSDVSTTGSTTFGAITQPAPIFTAPTSAGRMSNLTYEVGYARHLKNFRLAALSLEINASGFPSKPNPVFIGIPLNGTAQVAVGFASVFLVPGARFTFLSNRRISPFASGGAGLLHISSSIGASHLPSTDTWAFQYGGGADVKSPWRFMSFRTELRDFVAMQSGVDQVVRSDGLSSPDTRQNHLLLGGGAVFRF